MCLAAGSILLGEAGKRSVVRGRDDVDAAAGPADPTRRPSQGHTGLREVAVVNHFVLQNNSFIRFKLTPT